VEFRLYFGEWAASGTLDQLQGDHDNFFGMLLIKIIQLQSRLKQMVCDNLKFCGPLICAHCTVSRDWHKV